ncbi:MAG: terminase family protein [Nitrosopumilus sp.]|nr:terminase family protein [Nitrosopumilus sp.]
MASENYLGNPNLKNVGQKINWTEENLTEYMLCKEDSEHFIRNFVKIIHVDRGLVSFEMYDYQKDMVHTFNDNRFVICKMPRQTGKSTTIIAYLLHYVLFNENVNVAILANKGAVARELLGRLQLAYEHLPKWLQQGVVIWNKGNIELENGSKILASATSGSAVRGSSFNIIFLDEFAHVPSNIAEQFFTSVYPTISSGESTKVLIVSTPLGMNMFYKMWADAQEKRNNYVPLEVHWSQVPGRDEKWKQETIKNTSEVQFTQEFECEFIGSTHTLISATKLRTMVFKTPVFSKNGLDVYEEPIKNALYCMIVDTAQGKDQDYSAISIFDISQIPYRQVAKYRSNKISPMLYPDIIFHIGKKYNMSWVLLEVNDVGSQVAETLHYDLEYENIIVSSMKGRAGQQIGGGFAKNIQLGIRTSKQLKRIGCSALKEMIESDKLIISDFDTISELTTFAVKNNSYEAEEGSNDDLAMTLVIFSWLVQQRYFKDLTDLDIRKKLADEQMKALEEDLLPFGIIDDGRDAQTFTDNSGTTWTIDESSRAYF